MLRLIKIIIEDEKNTNNEVDDSNVNNSEGGISNEINK